MRWPMLSPMGRNRAELPPNGPSSAILYESETLRVVGNGLKSPIRFASFAHLLYRKQGGNFWGDEFFAKYGYGAIGFVSASPDWFPEEDMRQAVAAIGPDLVRTEGERLVAYGVSMGGYAALKYGALLGVDAAIAFSPQISINPAEVARFDPRYVRYYEPTRNGDMRIRAADLAPENYVLYDNFWTLDRKHAEQIAALGSVERFVLPFTGHASIRSIAEGHIAARFLERLAAPSPRKAAELRGMVRRTRKDTLVYWESRAVSLMGKRPAATRLILHAVRNARTLAPNAVVWQIAEVGALINCNEREEAEQALADIHLGAEAPIGLWARYIDCWRRIHGDGATIEMMGRAPPEVQSHPAFRFEDAVIRFDMGDVASAAAILSLIWPEQQQIARRMKLGQMLSATGEKEKALGVFRSLAEEAPTAEYLVTLAAALAEDRTNAEHLAEAPIHLGEARKIIDPDAALWRRVLLLYDALDARQVHVEAGREAVAALPGYPDLRAELAIALERNGQHDEALQLAVRLAPEHARIRRLDWLILIFRKAGMKAEAFALAHAAVADRPDDVASRLQLAVLLLERGEEEEAVTHLLALRGQASARLDLMQDAVAAFSAVGLHSDAAKAAGRLAFARVDQFDPQILLADCLIRAGLPKEATIHLRRVRRRIGDDAPGLCQIASRYRRAGDPTRAEELFARALGLSQDGNAESAWQTAARMELIALQSQHGGRRELAKARRAAAELERRGGTDPAFWCGLADLFATLGEMPRALAALGKAAALSPDDPAPKLREAELLVASRKMREAKTLLKALATPGSTRENFARALGALAKTEDGAAVRAAAEGRLAVAPHDSAAGLALARVLFAAGDAEGARARLIELMERRAGDAAFWSGVGDLFLELRDWPQAKLAAERAVANDPGNAKRAEEIIGIVRLLGNRAPPAQQSRPGQSRPEQPHGRIVARAARGPGLLSLLASTFRRS